MLTPVDYSVRYVCLLKVLNINFQPTFLLYSSQLRLLLSAEGQFMSIGPNYYFFIGEPGEKEDRNYIGKLRGNYQQTIYSLFDHGLPPS